MKAVGHHLESLDALRGATIAAMILVNNPGNWGAVFEPLEHSSWNGCRFADLVFPFFIFIMGFAMPLAFDRRRALGADRRRLSWRVIRRMATLVGLGLVLNAIAAVPDVAQWRIPGVLQRIGLAYGVCALIVLRAGPIGQTVAAVGLLATHWAVLALVPFGGYAGGTLTPLHNVAAFVDLRVFGQHLLTPFGEPEGLVGTATTVASGLLGALSGQWVRSRTADGERVAGLVCGSVAGLAAGWAWSFVLPVNKPLWTGSYVLVTAGLAGMTLAVAYYVVDMRRWTRLARPFVWLGVNPLVIYFLSEVTGHALERPWIPLAAGPVAAKDFLFWNLFAPLLDGTGGPRASLAFAVCFASMWVGVAGVLYRRGIRVHV